MADSAAHDGAEVLDEAPEGDLKGIYDDIRSAFRVPFVNLVFRVLANHRDFFQLSWRQLHPNVQTVYFEDRADDIRARAVEGMQRLGTPPAGAPADAIEVLKLFHYVNPKLLIAVAALRAAVNGQYPRLAELPMAEKRQIAPGVPAGAPAISMVDAATSDPALRPLFDDLRTTLGLRQLNSDYRALAAWPEYLNSAWSTLKPLVGTDGYRALDRSLRRMADDAVLNLPFRVELNPHVLRHAGLSEAELDEVRSILDRFYRLLPGLVANVSFWAAGALGAEAESSPYPASTL